MLNLVFWLKKLSLKNLMIDYCKTLKTTSKCRTSSTIWPPISFLSYFSLMLKLLLKIERLRNKFLKLILKNTQTFFLRFLTTSILWNVVVCFQWLDMITKHTLWRLLIMIFNNSSGYLSTAQAVNFKTLTFWREIHSLWLFWFSILKQEKIE